MRALHCTLRFPPATSDPSSSKAFCLASMVANSMYPMPLSVPAMRGEVRPEKALDACSQSNVTSTAPGWPQATCTRHSSSVPLLVLLACARTCPYFLGSHTSRMQRTRTSPIHGT
jgi:hypothetical protein